MTAFHFKSCPPEYRVILSEVEGSEVVFATTCHLNCVQKNQNFGIATTHSEQTFAPDSQGARHSDVERLKRGENDIFAFR